MAFDNIPRVNVEVQDGGLRITPTSIEPKVTLLGVTDNPLATVNEPYLARRVDDARNRFDKADGSPSELSIAFEEASDGGGDNIELMNISGVPTITDANRFNALAESYKLLLNHNVDIVVPVGATIDNTNLSSSQNFGYQLADFCYNSTVRNDSCIGVIGVENSFSTPSGVPSLSDISTWHTALVNFTNASIYDGVTDSGGDGIPDNYAFWATDDNAIPVGSPPSSDGNVIKDRRGNPVDIGAYISVVAGEARFFNDTAIERFPEVGFYNANGANAYAGMIASLPSFSGTTNKVLPGSSVIRNLSLSQVDALIGARYVAFMQKTRGFVVARDITGAYNIDQYNRSDFVNLTTVRIVHDAVNLVREVADPFIGEPNNAAQRNALETAIDEGLQRMLELGALRRFDFSLISTATQQVLGEMTVDLILVPAFEILRINVSVSLRSQ